MNKVLSATYHAVYSDAREGDELTLLTAPLASTAEVQSLYEAGLIDVESALPAALHSLGCTALEVAGAVKRRRDSDSSGSDSKLIEAQNMFKMGDADVQLKGAQTGKILAETKVIKSQVGAPQAEKQQKAAAGAGAGAGAGTSAGAGGKNVEEEEKKDK